MEDGGGEPGRGPPPFRPPLDAGPWGWSAGRGRGGAKVGARRPCPGTSSSRCGCRCASASRRGDSAAPPPAGWCAPPYSRSTCGPGPGPPLSTCRRPGVRSRPPGRGAPRLPTQAWDSQGKGPTGPRAVVHCDSVGAAVEGNLPGDRDGGAEGHGVVARGACREGGGGSGGVSAPRGPAGSPSRLPLPSCPLSTPPPPGCTGSRRPPAGTHISCSSHWA